MATIIKRFLDWLTTNPDIQTGQDPPVKEEIDPVLRAMEIFKALSKDWNVRALSSDTAMATLVCPIRQIDLYTKELSTLIFQLKEGRDISVGSPLFERPTSVPLRTFFTTSTGHYASPSEDGTQYAYLSYDLLRLYVQLRDKEANNYTEKRNRRLLKDTVNLLIKQAEELETWRSEKRIEDLPKTSSPEQPTAS